MSEITKPSGINIIWASGGDKIDPGNVKYQTGWAVELPPRQWENFIQNKQDQAIAHINQHGVPVWDSATEYQANKSYTQGPTNGLVYKCVSTNINQNPETDVTNTYWKVAFVDTDGALSESVANTLYLKLASNGSDIPSAPTFRSNIGVYSTTQVDTLITNSNRLDTVRIDVASAATVGLTVAAPNTRHINITGTTAISAFTVAAGSCYFVRFSGALTLTNGASLVTNTGGNITTAAGDSCVIRATAANVVEVLCYTSAIIKSVGVGQTWLDVLSSRVAGTTYTNSTGKPIAVNVATGNATSQNLSITVDGIVTSKYDGSSVAGNGAFVTAIVPNGSTYSVTTTNTIIIWTELR